MDATKTALQNAIRGERATVGRANVTYDQGTRRFTVTAAGFAPRATASCAKAADLLVGWA